MKRYWIGIAASAVIGVAAAQTLPSLMQIRPASGTVSTVLATVAGRMVWADIGAGLTVEMQPNGRALIKAPVPAPVPTHRHVTGEALALTWVAPRTCTTAPSSTNIVVYLNGLRVYQDVDYVIDATTRQLCFGQHLGNLTLIGADGYKESVRADYTVP